jgi:hypothetical protein
MGQPRFLRSGVALALALVLGGCGTGDAGLLASADVDEIYSGAGGSAYAAISKNAADFGTITGKVNYTGRKRARKVDLAKAFCIGSNPSGMMSEDFLVGQGGELAGCVVYVKRGLSGVAFPAPSGEVVLDQVNCQYIPHVAILRIGQPLVVKSSDDEAHNVHGMPGPNGEFNIPMNAPGSLDPMTFAKQQVPMDIRCDVHSWMQAWHEKLGELTVDVNLAKNESKSQDFTFEAK